MQKYCFTCKKETEMNLVQKKETYKVCGDPIEVDAQVLICSECGEEQFSKEYDNATLVSAYEEYRKKHRLLFPEEMVEIRDQYHLTQRAFASLLNLDEKTMRRYENGTIQNKVSNSLMKLLQDPKIMETYLKENETGLSQRQQDKLLAIVKDLIKGNEIEMAAKFLARFFPDEPCNENGFKIFDFEKFCAMVLFFAEKEEHILKTKLAKLLYYSDMTFYKENKKSISGSRYINHSSGVLPENFDLVLGLMEAEHLIRNEIIYENGCELHCIITEENIPANVLSEYETNTLEHISEVLQGNLPMEIPENSDKGCTETKIGEFISYEFAKDFENRVGGGD